MESGHTYTVRSVFKGFFDYLSATKSTFHVLLLLSVFTRFFGKKKYRLSVKAAVHVFWKKLVQNGDRHLNLTLFSGFWVLWGLQNAPTYHTDLDRSWTGGLSLPKDVVVVISTIWPLVIN